MLDFGPFITIYGIGRYQFTDDWYNNEIEGVCISFKDDGKDELRYLYCETNPDDGYRSYGLFYEESFLKENITIFPFAIPQDCTVQLIEEDIEDPDLWEPIKRDWLQINSYNRNLPVIMIGTDHTDSYYPIALFRYEPENFDIYQNS